MTAPEVFRNGLPGHNVDTGAKVAECFWKVHHADGDRDDRASWIASLDLTLLRMVVVVVVVVIVDVVHVLKHLRAVIA